MGILDDRVVIITGGARGMGAAHARHFVAEGAQVVIGDVLDDAGEALVDELGKNASYVHHDVTDEAAWETIVREATAQFGRLDGLVNNAGVLVFQPMAEMDLAGFRRILDINLTGSWLGIRAVAPVLSAGGGGSIVNVSSINGMAGAAGLTAYTASKFAVRGLTKAAAQELGAAGVRVNSIHPGGIATPMTQGPGDRSDTDSSSFFARVPIARWGQPEEVSPLAAFLLSDQSAYCTGSEFVVDGGVLSGVPF
ncbi:SDR family oxidoreductase [Nocardioides immobilis]|uniref:SDR family oxidoreductase n=1 Tax=Nocardioides immobilis TaxID=2049295 RepID=A0A417XWF5_9ACTN|nr:glucose 1-dehydrogenase [Nocardioides immobilis]RHW24713.1 SDR family oxidoreductase [Nocardioides immobilis]